MKKISMAVLLLAGYSGFSQSVENGRSVNASPGIVSETLNEYLGDLPQLQINHASGTWPLDLDALMNQPVVRDQVFIDDLIVQGSACIGLDCDNGEDFGFDTQRLKENNVRLKFEDTSNSASFPGNDWELTANESTNGGENMFAITDVTNSKIPFKVLANAPTGSLHIDDSGDIGLGTTTPVVELHVADGDSPTMRLEQNGSSGFTPQTWDVAGNETNFFVRDVTNGSKLPFKIKPGAPTNALFVAASGTVALGNESPFADVKLDVEGSIAMSEDGTLYQNETPVLDFPGTGNTHVGRSTGTSSTGSNNVLVGESAGELMTSGSANLCVGYGAGLWNSTGNDNVNVGQFAGTRATTGKENVCIGSRAGYSNITGIRSVVIGRDAGRFSTSGYNSFMGYRAGYNNTTGTYNTYLGYASGFTPTNLSNATSIGNSANATVSNSVVVGNSSVTSIGGQVNWTALSDKRFKKNIKEDAIPGLDFISKLTPVTYNFDLAARARWDEEKFGLKDETRWEGKNEIEGVTFSGFLAQDVEQAAIDAGYDFSGVDAPKNDNDIYGLRYAEFVVPLVVAVQEQQEQIEELKEEAEASVDSEVLSDVVAENAALKQALESLTNRLDAMESDLQQCCMNHQEGNSSSNSNSSNGLGVESAQLEQNQPNPFRDNSVIKYYLPSNAMSASMTITDMDGTELKTFNLQGKGYGQVMIGGGTLTSGTYIYTLTVNGERVDSKRMMLL